MCGIVGYIGKDDALINLKSKIKLLEYRGYDSSGLCVIDSKTNNFYIKKNCRHNWQNKRFKKN